MRRCIANCNGAGDEASDQRGLRERRGARRQLHERSAPCAAKVDRAVGDGASDLATYPDYHWTWRVIHAGCSLAECAQIRQLDPSTVVRHLLQAAEVGHPVRAAQVFSPEELQLLSHLAVQDDDEDSCQPRRSETVLTADQQALFQQCEDRDTLS